MSTPFYDLASLVVVPSGYKASKVYAQKPLTTDGQLTFSRASTATRVNSAGLIETVSSNVPRLDYQGSTCPKLQLEPSGTNVLAYSSELNNAGWAAGAVVTANTATSPDGTQNADSVMEAGINDYQILGRPFTTTSGTAYTFSFFAKPNGRNFARILFGNGSFPDDRWAYFNLLTGATSVNASVTASMVSYGNGWYRCIATLTSDANATDAIYFGPARNMTDGYARYTGNTSAGIYAWGVQQEAGSYATSLIQTTTAAVTRLADVCSKTGISSLIGQTEGTVLIDVTGPAKYVLARYMTLSNGTDTHRIVIYSNGATTAAVYFQNPTGGAIQIGFNTVNGRMKIACGYKNNDVVVYVNGVNVGVNNNYNTAFSFNFVGIGTYEDGTISNSLGQGVNQALVFKTRLTNAQLAELTAL